MEASELISTARAELVDTAQPYLWSDDLMLEYLRAGELEFSRRTNILVDDSLTVTTTQGTNIYHVDDNVARIIGANIQGENPMAQVRGHPYRLRRETTEGKPTIFGIHPRKKELVLYPVPDGAYTIEIMAVMNPSTPVEGLSDEPSIPEEDHHALVWYICYRCLINNDADGSNPGTAKTYHELWHTYLRDTKREQYRALRTDMIKPAKWTGKGRQ